jgi:hypothetical protein
MLWFYESFLPVVWIVFVLYWGTTEAFGNYTKGHFADGTVFSLNAGLPPQ